jgi:DNA-binding MarR family transcriptional regulator
MLLTLVKMKVNTPYRLMKEADISLGASTGAIRRLEKEGLLSKKQSTTGREKVELRLTAKGREHLQAPFDLKSPAPGFESAIRHACILLLEGRSKAAAGMLEQLADRRLQERPKEARFKRGAGLYQWMIRTCDRGRRQAEHEALREIARKIRRLN